MAEEFFNLKREYLSNPKLFSRNSLTFNKTGYCSSDNSIENTDSISVLDIKKDPSPSINPNNQYLVIFIFSSYSSEVTILRFLLILPLSSNIFCIRSLDLAILVLLGLSW